MSKKSICSLGLIVVLCLVLTNAAKSDDPGWPVNCVKLSPGQAITIDGVVTPEEYNGAQELIINDQTLDVPDPHLPYVHNGSIGAADDDPSLEDFSVTYYFMWDDQFLYVAATATDDINQQYGTTPNHMDCLQFCLAASPQEQDRSQIAIPTVAPADGNGNILAKTDFGGWLLARVAEESEIAGGVDPDTQDWVLEMAIPWDNLVGVFSADLAKGDSDGNGRDVFPPYPGDVVGFVAFGIDVDSDAGYTFFSCTHNSMPWDGAGLGELRFVEPTASIGMASRPSPSDGALIEETWVTLKWWPGNFAVLHDVYLGGNFDDVDNATKESELFRGNQVSTLFVAGFPGFAYPDGLVPGSTYYWRIDEVNDADPNSPWKGLVWSFSIPAKTAYDPFPADGAEFVDLDVQFTWTGGYGSKLHTVHLGESYEGVDNASGGIPIGTNTYDPGTLERENVMYWRVDEFDGVDTYKGQVWSFATPGAVANPQPAYGATDVAMNAILSWTPADSAASHQLYFGTDRGAVRNADTGAPEYRGSRTLDAETYDPGLLDADTTYYWRVDEVDAQSNTAKGPLWIFTTGSFLLVDDFEGYTDDDAAGEAIWQTWVDGFGVADNGAQVGYLLPPYTEQTIVHGGAQSMPLSYVNEAGVTNSEASLKLTAPRDWTQANVAELSLWIRGISTNAAYPLYVSLSNSAGAPAVVAHDDLEAALKGIWTQWIIPLQAFTDQGINLSNVDKIAIGLGTKAGATGTGGTGKMYIDDIRLYRP